MAYINDELNNKIREKFSLFFFRYEEYERCIGSNYVEDSFENYKDKIPYIDELMITDFIVGETDGKVKVDLCLHRPGLIIGKRGCLIDAIRKYFKEDVKMDVEFNLYESTMWHRTSTRPKNNITKTDLCY